MRFRIVLAAVLALQASGCAGDKTRGEAGSASSGATGARSPGAAQRPGSVEAAAAALGQRVVLFDFDSDALRADAAPIIDTWVRYLADRPDTKVRLAGHADERGTREYNVALGERRANAVERALTARGASARQISVISFGEERPADPGHGEQAWSQNRRVEIAD